MAWNPAGLSPDGNSLIWRLKTWRQRLTPGEIPGTITAKANRFSNGTQGVILATATN
jgi:hypothetical protein